ncbi:hypothetical protein GOODEAATRI_007991 [Goodea atripinnis]|uniref:Uncharacterized protein n=1 Tax=Goodea atripinnis TaxID=208336 RepID=A0ABV0PW99_9TELE
MQIGRLSKEERERHWREGLCGYCGSAKHRRPQCPLRPGNAEARTPSALPCRLNLHPLRLLLVVFMFPPIVKRRL